MGIEFMIHAQLENNIHKCSMEIINFNSKYICTINIILYNISILSIDRGRVGLNSFE